MYPKKDDRAADYWRLFILFVIALLLAGITAIAALAMPEIPWLQVAAPIVWVALFFVPFIPFIQIFDEIGIPGFFSAKLRQSVATIQKRQLLNRVITVADDVYYWIDASEIAHPLRDFATAEFLSQGEGIVRLASDEWKTIQKSTQSMQSFRTATPLQNGPDKFILYNETLYYLRSLGPLYKLAALNDIDIEQREIDSWEDSDGEKWMKNVTADDFRKYSVA